MSVDRVELEGILYVAMLCISIIPSSHEKNIHNTKQKNQVDLVKPYRILDNKISRMHTLCLDVQSNLCCYYYESFFLLQGFIV